MKPLRQFHCSAAWPPRWLAAMFFAVYLIFVLGIWLISRSLPPFQAQEVLHSEDNAPFFSIAIATAAVFHVVARFFRFHPACGPRYASWLALSPWTSAKPLPLGPLHPVWQDAAVLAVLAALAQWHAHVDPALPLAAAGLAYAIGLTLLLAATLTWPWFVTACLIWPSTLLTHGKWQPLSVILTALAVVLWMGTRKSLQAFPWREKDRTQPGLSNPANTLLQSEIRVEAATSSNVGWAFAQLSPKARFASVSNATSFWVSLLLGWWAYCLMTGLGADPVPGLVLAYGVVAGLIRLGIYWGGIAPSFSFRSRIFFGRLIVPGFDQIFIAPLIAIFVAVIGGMMTAHAAKWALAAQAFFFGLITFILFAAKPAMRNWVLTGEHRFRPVLARGTTRQGYRPI
jgi:hypothetical protein